MASAATHAVLPKLATLAGRRLQVDAGLRSHGRRFGAPRGSGSRNAPTRPASRASSRSGRRLHLPGPERPRRGTAALAPVRLPGGPVAFTIDWPTVRLVWSDGGYPSDPAYLEYHRLSENGIRLWSISGRPYDPAVAAKRAAEHAASFLARSATGWSATAPSVAAAVSASSRSTRSCSATGGPRDRSGSGRC